MPVIQINTSYEKAPPAYTAGYTEAPLDESTEEYHHCVDIPDHEIAIVDRQYVTNKHIIYCLKEGFKTYNTHTHMLDCNIIDIFDSEGNKQYSCIKKEIESSFVTYTTHQF